MHFPDSVCMLIIPWYKELEYKRDAKLETLKRYIFLKKQQKKNNLSGVFCVNNVCLKQNWSTVKLKNIPTADRDSYQSGSHTHTHVKAPESLGMCSSDQVSRVEVEMEMEGGVRAGDGVGLGTLGGANTSTSTGQRSQGRPMDISYRRRWLTRDWT